MPRTLRRGDAGPEVARWQALLSGAAFPVPATGSFDAATEQATRAWQGARGLPADGVVGPASWAAMTGEGRPKTFAEMLELIEQHQRSPGRPFTPQLLMAIFWEESLFTNTSQVHGTAIGFGQVEPAEMPKITTDRARALGYYVEGVSASTRELPDDLSVTVPSCYLLHLYHSSDASTVEGRVEFALRAYAGVYYEGPSSLTRERRLEIVEGWRRCERALLALPLTVAEARRNASPDLEDAYMAALQHARPFRVETMRERLFPPGWERRDEGARPERRGRGLLAVGLLLVGIGAGALVAARYLPAGAITAAWGRLVGALGPRRSRAARGRANLPRALPAPVPTGAMTAFEGPLMRTPPPAPARPTRSAVAPTEPAGVVEILRAQAVERLEARDLWRAGELFREADRIERGGTR